MPDDRDRRAAGGGGSDPQEIDEFLLGPNVDELFSDVSVGGSERESVEQPTTSDIEEPTATEVFDQLRSEHGTTDTTDTTDEILDESPQDIIDRRHEPDEQHLDDDLIDEGALDELLMSERREEGGFLWVDTDTESESAAGEATASPGDSSGPVDDTGYAGEPADETHYTADDNGYTTDETHYTADDNGYTTDETHYTADDTHYTADNTEYAGESADDTRYTADNTEYAGESADDTRYTTDDTGYAGEPADDTRYTTDDTGYAGEPANDTRYTTDDTDYASESADDTRYTTDDTGYAGEPADDTGDPDEPVADSDEPADDADYTTEGPDEPTETGDDEAAAEAGDGAQAAPVETDGEGVVGGHHPTQREPEAPDPDEDIGGISTPPDDEEMPLADHIQEMVGRLAVVLLFGATGTAVGLLGASEAIEFVWADVIPGEYLPHLFHPLELWLTRIKISALLGILVALPMFVYQCYRFMRPGLYPHERKYYIAAVPMSLVLASLGMVFSYLLVLPTLFSYFTFYSEGSAEVQYALGVTFDLVITLTGFLAIVFQIPLFIMLAIMMGVTTRRWLAQKRLYFWAGFLGVSFMFTADPTMMAPFMVAIVMVFLFEGTLALLKWTGR